MEIFAGSSLDKQCLIDWMWRYTGRDILLLTIVLVLRSHFLDDIEGIVWSVDDPARFSMTSNYSWSISVKCDRISLVTLRQVNFLAP